jgi:hypothetical protein
VEHTQSRCGSIRIFPFGIGTDVNTHLLDRIATVTNAVSQYVLPEEDIEVKLSSFYTKIKEPALTNVQMVLGGDGIKTSELYPTVLPDLFKGQMLFAFGRYSGHGKGSAKISGMLNGQKQDFVTDVNFTADDTSNAFIPRLWATRRVGWLLDEIRMHGESKELKDEVVRLARAHGIVTPYTAFLIMEDEQRRGVPLSSQNLRELSEDRGVALKAKDFYDSTNAEALDPRMRSGSRAVTNSANLDSLKQGLNESETAQPFELAKSAAAAGPTLHVTAGATAINGLGTAAGGMPSTQPAGYRATRNYAQQVKVVNGRAFYQNNDTWTDSAIQSKKDAKRMTLKFNSDEYFAVLAKYPHAAQWMSLGNNVDVLIDDTVYVVR